MGEVYRARDPRIGRDVAIKVLPASLSQDRDRLRRFEQEARAAGALNHPALLTIHDFGEQDGAPYLVSELLEGETLRTRLHGGPLAPRRAIDCAIQIARGLAAAHGKGIVHRDIKPENLFITKDGRVKILDFGLAKLRHPEERGSEVPTFPNATEPGTVMGTAGYMSPEQVRGEDVDQRSDIFSLGTVLYECLTGDSPFKRDSAAETMSAILKEDPPEITATNKQISPAVAKVVSRCLEKHKEARYQSAADLAFHLEDVSDISAPALAPSSRLLGRLLIGAALVLLLGTAGYLIWRRNAALDQATQKRETSASATTGERKMIVVLPFEHLGDRDDENLTDGITQEISSRLSANSRLGVISRTSALQYKNSKKSARQIGQELSVDYILEGTLRWQREPRSRIRLTTDLIRAADDSQLWSESFDRDLRDIFDVQSEIARNVTDKIGLALDPRRHDVAPTGNLDAYQEYLRGLSVNWTWTQSTQLGLAEQLFAHAVKLDPHFAVAWARLSEVHSNLYYTQDHSAQRLEKARVALDMARRLAPSDAVTLNAEGLYYARQQQEDRSRQAFEAAQRISRNDPEAMMGLGESYAHQGKVDLSLEQEQRALSLDPRNAGFLSTVAANLNRLRRFSEAASLVERAIAVRPEQSDLYGTKAMYLFQATGNPLEAEKETERAPDAWSFPMLESKVRLLVYGGDCRSALAILDRWPVATQPKMQQGVYVRIEGVWRTTCGQPARGHQVLLRALKLWNELVIEQPKLPFVHVLRGVTLADLGRKEEAIAEMKLGFDLYSGNLMAQNTARHGMAEIYSVTGEHKAALDLIDEVLKEPASFPLTVHELRFAPWWKPLWNEPRFQSLLRQERKP